MLRVYPLYPSASGDIISYTASLSAITNQYPYTAQSSFITIHRSPYTCGSPCICGTAHSIFGVIFSCERINFEVILSLVKMPTISFEFVYKIIARIFTPFRSSLEKFRIYQVLPCFFALFHCAVINKHQYSSRMSDEDEDNNFMTGFLFGE